MHGLPCETLELRFIPQLIQNGVEQSGFPRAYLPDHEVETARLYSKLVDTQGEELLIVDV